MLKEILYKKTVTLFETAFVFGWLFGGGMIAQLDLVKKAAYHFGMAFQIADDFGILLKMRKISVRSTRLVFLEKSGRPMSS